MRSYENWDILIEISAWIGLRGLFNLLGTLKNNVKFPSRW